MRQEGFDRFEEALEEFRVRFDDQFLLQPYSMPGRAELDSRAERVAPFGAII
jgi:hypothetical protein